MMKIAMLLALIGHIICGVSDCLLSYSKSGRLDLKAITDPDKMADMFKDMPLSFPLASMLLGTFAITMFSFGYFALSDWISDFSKTASTIMYISSVIFLIPIVTHHVFCGVVEWIYIRLGRTNAVREAVLEMQIKTIATMVVGYLGLAAFMITLFVMIVSGNTSLPVWACVFNTLAAMIVLAPTKLPAKGNIAGAVMYLGLLILI
ncbi:MAG: hypothetical protein J1F11_12845 [Oscillospiraceae bacterium]|nr:hypothetical protein [Oscillospiraceae bacterium]